MQRAFGRCSWGFRRKESGVAWRVSRFSRCVTLVVTIAVLSSCDDLVGPSLEVDQRFATHQEAVDAGALHGNSFIPPFTPKSATDIHDIHDADINTGHGSFSFDPNNAEDFRKSIAQQEVDTAELKALETIPEPGEEAYRTEDHVLFVDWDAGKCRYWLEVNR